MSDYKHDVFNTYKGKEFYITDFKHHLKAEIKFNEIDHSLYVKMMDIATTSEMRDILHYIEEIENGTLKSLQ